MMFNLIDLGIQPSEIEAMDFSCMTMYNDCHKVKAKAYDRAAADRKSGA